MESILQYFACKLNLFNSDGRRKYFGGFNKGSVTHCLFVISKIQFEDKQAREVSRKSIETNLIVSFCEVRTEKVGSLVKYSCCLSGLRRVDQTEQRFMLVRDNSSTLSQPLNTTSPSSV